MVSKKEHGRRRFLELQERNERIGSRHKRKIEKFSDNFKTIFNFFLQSYRSGILTFGGENVTVINDSRSFCARGSFRRFDDGQFKFTDIVSRHSNITKAVIIAKKSWGLHLKEWSEGVREGLFRKDEILKVFSDKNIIIPYSFLKEFYNLIYKSFNKPNIFFQMLEDQKTIQLGIKEGKTLDEIAKKNPHIKFNQPI